MQPADIRTEPWVWIPLPRRRVRVLPTIMVAAISAVAGYMMGRHSVKTGVASLQKTVAASPITQPVAVNKSGEAGEKPDLALKSDGETAKHTPALQTKPEAPPVVLLNPGTADPRGNVRDPATTRERRAPPTRASSDETPRSDDGQNKPRDERAVGAPNSMRDYRDLREYMLGR
jgi:hypothetical protein